jgi:hypothetical protein
MNYEGRTTEAVESKTAKVPSLVYMGFAVASMVASATLMVTGRKQLANFVGQWAPSILIMGLYNKITKELALPQREGMARFSSGISSGANLGSPAGASAGL